MTVPANVVGGTVIFSGPWLTISAVFTAPSTTGALTFTFTLTVSDTGGLNDSDATVVAVTTESGNKFIYLPLVMKN